ncbi:MAG: alpha/beta fold hydrolase [Alcaligenaceae bacterium]|nr:MAG: alpha/beta fold hydrolase [Alcaligenaceae bacterium]
MRSSVISGIGVRQVGEGPPLVLIPGLAGLASFWDGVANELAGIYHVISLDHPGMGNSQPVTAHSIEAVVSGVVRVLDDMKVPRCAVVGHSTGGLVAQSIALDFPSRLTKIVLSSTWAAPDQRFRDLFQLRQFVLDHAGHAAYARLGQLLAHPSEWYEKYLSTESCAPLETGSDPRTDVIGQRIQMLLSYQRIDELASIKLPTMVLGALDDNIVPFNHSLDLARRIPGAKLSELAGGHFTPTTRTADYARVVATFAGASV